MFLFCDTYNLELHVEIVLVEAYGNFIFIYAILVIFQYLCLWLLICICSFTYFMYSAIATQY